MNIEKVLSAAGGIGCKKTIFRALKRSILDLIFSISSLGLDI